MGVHRQYRQYVIALACWVFEMILAAAGVWETIAEINEWEIGRSCNCGELKVYILQFKLLGSDGQETREEVNW